MYSKSPTPGCGPGSAVFPLLRLHVSSSTPLSLSLSREVEMTADVDAKRMDGLCDEQCKPLNKVSALILK